MTVSVTLARIGTATWGLTLSRDGQVFAVGTVERDGGIYNAYVSPERRSSAAPEEPHASLAALAS